MPAVYDADMVILVAENNSLCILVALCHLKPTFGNSNVVEFKDLCANIQNDTNRGIQSCDHTQQCFSIGPCHSFSSWHQLHRVLVLEKILQNQSIGMLLPRVVQLRDSERKKGPRIIGAAETRGRVRFDSSDVPPGS